jgi:hypothetical protein
MSSQVQAPVTILNLTAQSSSSKRDDSNISKRKIESKRLKNRRFPVQ